VDHVTWDGTSKFRPADPASKLASGSNQPQPFERGLQSALADADIDIDLCGSQAECGLIDLIIAADAAPQHNFRPSAASFYFSCRNFAIRIERSSLRRQQGWIEDI
jgi:hypothetical protein